MGCTNSSGHNLQQNESLQSMNNHNDIGVDSKETGNFPESSVSSSEVEPPSKSLKSGEKECISHTSVPSQRTETDQNENTSNTVQPQDTTQSSTSFLTDSEIEVLKASWQILSSNLSYISMKIFFTVFEKSPQAMLIFPFKDAELIYLSSNQTFRAHASR